MEEVLAPSKNKPIRLKSGLVRDAGCRMCRLHEVAEYVCLLGTGPVPCDVMIVGEAPGQREDDSGTPFVGRSGQLLDDMMAKVGINRQEVFITNAVSCRPPDNRTPTKAEIRKCQSWLQYQISRVKPKVVLLLGNVPLESVLGLKGIKKLRGQPIERNGVVYLPTYHPAYILRDDRNLPFMKADLTKFKAMMDGGGMPVIPGLNYRIVRTKGDVADMVRHLRRIPGFVYDLETKGLTPWKHKVTSINIGNRDKQWCIPVNHHEEQPWTEDEVQDIVDEIDALNKPKCNHNAKFDALFMKVHFGVSWYVEFDTMLAHHALNENALHALDAVASEKFGALDWDVPLPVKQGETGTLEEHARYACLDVLYTDMLWESLDEELTHEPAVDRLFHKLIMPAAAMFVDAEFHGVTVDHKKFNDAERKLVDDMHTVELQLNKLEPGVNWGSPQQVAKVLFQKLGLSPLDMTKGGSPSTSESVLKRLAGEHEIPRLLMKHRAAKQQLSFFIEGWKPWTVHTKNRAVLHPSFKIHGTVTGRLSCENPNLQQVPRDPSIRQLIIAKPGWELIEADLSQIELRILAELSGDPEMMRCFQTGIDVHWLTALREIFRGGGYRKQVIETALAITRRNQIEYEECHEILLKAGPDAAVDHGPPPDGEGWPGWKETRKKAKAINFGYAYGMWWKKFILYARDNYDMEVTELEAQASRTSYFDLYARLPKWHQRQKEFARRNGYVRSLIGRKRRLPHAQDIEDSFERGEAERQSINAPVQGLASDLNLMAALELRRKHSSSYFQIVGTVHDSILMECRKSRLQQVVPDVLKVMSEPEMLKRFNVEMRVPIEAEVKLGPWGLGVSPKKYFAAGDP